MGVKSLQDQPWSAGITLQDLILSFFAYINQVKMNAVEVKNEDQTFVSTRSSNRGLVHLV